MAGRQARILLAAQLDGLMQHVRGHRDYVRSRVIILLSHFAGLRAAQIAKLEWSMVLAATGKFGQSTKASGTPLAKCQSAVADVKRNGIVLW